ncbi:hypothetical protein LJC07_06565 [Christensenellaceae bacterium OttesenSCG-928-L17]|nr:hypothetical protein [Christensenellaceae bacterium OttesenSCG-928-L17]
MVNYDSENPYDAKMDSDFFYSALLDGTANNFIIIATMGKVHKNVATNNRDNTTAFSLSLFDWREIQINGTTIKRINNADYFNEIAKLFLASSNGKLVSPKIGVGRTYAKLLNDLGFSGKLRSLFFPIASEKQGILVHRRITYKMLTEAGITRQEIQAEINKLAAKIKK